MTDQMDFTRNPFRFTKKNRQIYVLTNWEWKLNVTKPNSKRIFVDTLRGAHTNHPLDYIEYQVQQAEKRGKKVIGIESIKMTGLSVAWIASDDKDLPWEEQEKLAAEHYPFKAGDEISQEDMDRAWVWYQGALGYRQELREMLKNRS